MKPKPGEVLEARKCAAGYYYRHALSAGESFRAMWLCAALQHLLADECFLNEDWEEAEMCARFLAGLTGLAFPVSFEDEEQRSVLSVDVAKEFFRLRDGGAPNASAV